MRGLFRFIGTLITICLLVGVLMIGIGIWRGGIPGTLEKISKGDFSFAGDGLNSIIGFFGGPGDADWNGGNFSKDYPIIMDADGTHSVSVKNAKDMVWEFGGVNVTIEKADVADIQISFEKVKKFQAYEEGDKVYIRAIGGTTVGNPQGKISVQIPTSKDWNEVELEFGAGTMKMQDFTCKKMKLEIGAGTVTADGLSCETLDYQLGAGTAEFENCAVRGDVKMEAGAGKTVYKGTMGGNLKAESAAGEMKITLTDTKESDHNYKLACAAGSLKVGSIDLSGLGSEKKVDNSADTTYDITSAAGSFVLKFE